MLCPRCDRHTLAPQPTEDPEAKVDRCRVCNGLWFGAGSLTRVMAVAAKQLKMLDDATPSGLICPDCSEPMSHFSYPQTLVVVDMCPGCEGIWLDKGELHEVRTVRSHLQQTGRLQTHAPVVGLKGALIRFIDAAIHSLSGRFTN